MMDLQKIDYVTRILLSSLEKSGFNTGKTEIVSICPFCNGGRKKERSFYVSIPTKEKPRFLYKCFRASCRQGQTKGYITPDFLRMLDCNNYEANIYLNSLNKQASKEKKFSRKLIRNIKNFPSPENKLSKAKLKYINDRLGLNLTFKDLYKLKIHTDMEELFEYNGITIPKNKEYYYRNLSDHGIGFISTYNDYIIIRNVTGTDKIRRYSIVDIFEDEDDIDKFKTYNIPTKIDILSPDPVELIMAEGTFDILSVYFNIEDEKEFNRIYCSVSGSSYEKTINHYIRQYGLLDLIIKIYSDTGIELSYFEKIYKNIKRYTNSLEMFVYYNKKYKDFGVSKKEIDIQENYIWN
jgi:hypothetical protein